MHKERYCRIDVIRQSELKCMWRMSSGPNKMLSYRPVWFNCRPAGRMWPTTPFSVARERIQEKSSNPKFDEKRDYIWGNICLTELLALDKVHLHTNNAFLCTILFYLFYDQFTRYGPALNLRCGIWLDNLCVFSTSETMNLVPPNKYVCLSAKRGLLKVTLELN